MNNRHTIIWPQPIMFSICLQGCSMGRGWGGGGGGGGGGDFPLTVFWPKKSKHEQSNKKLKLQCNLPENWNNDVSAAGWNIF